jgi:hypothetical protein
MNIKTLLHKTTTFEKLALFGNRKEFLKSIAQMTFPLSFPDSGLSSALALVQNSISVATRELLKSNPDASWDLSKFVKQLNSKIITDVIPTEVEANQKSNALLGLMLDIKQYISSLSVENDMNNIIETSKINVDRAIQLIQSFRSKFDWGPQSVPAAELKSTPVPSVKTKTTQSIKDLFNFYYNKLTSSTKSSNLKELMIYIPKMEKLVSKLEDMSIRNIKSQDGTEYSKLEDLGRTVIYNAKTKLGIPVSTTESFETEPYSPTEI